jgi:hypothetical protein
MLNGCPAANDNRQTKSLVRLMDPAEEFPAQLGYRFHERHRTEDCFMPRSKLLHPSDDTPRPVRTTSGVEALFAACMLPE